MAQDADRGGAGTPCPDTTEQENKAIALRHIEEARNGQNLAVVDDLFAPDHVHHRAVGPDERGIEARRRSLAAWHAAFPDLRHHVEDVIAEGDKVAVRYTARGTQRGEFQGIAPSGGPVAWTGVFIFRIACGRIAETWVATDALTQIRRAAANPTP